MYNLVVPSKRGGGSEVGAIVGGRISYTAVAIDLMIFGDMI
jgi:hypothetical protein